MSGVRRRAPADAFAERDRVGARLYTSRAGPARVGRRTGERETRAEGRAGSEHGAPISVSQVPAAGVLRRRRSGARHPHAAERRRRGRRRARVSVQRAARHRQDHDRAHPRQGARLRERADARPGPDTCESCREIAEGRHPDVYELDAASRTGVDAIRDEVISKVNYAADARRATRSTSSTRCTCCRPRRSTRCSRRSRNRRPHGVRAVHDAPAQGARDDPVALPALRLPPHPRRRHRRDGCAFIALPRRPSRSEPGAHADRAPRRGRACATRSGRSSSSRRSPAGRSPSTDVEGLLGEVDTARLAEAVSLLGDRDVAGLFPFVARLAESGTDVQEFVSRAVGARARPVRVAATDGEPGIVDATEADARAAARRRRWRFGLDRLSRLLDELGRLGERAALVARRAARAGGRVRPDRPAASRSSPSRRWRSGSRCSNRRRPRAVPRARGRRPRPGMRPRRPFPGGRRRRAPLRSRRLPRPRRSRSPRDPRGRPRPGRTPNSTSPSSGAAGRTSSAP